MRHLALAIHWGMYVENGHETKKLLPGLRSRNQSAPLGVEQAMREKEDLAYFGKRAVEEEARMNEAEGEQAQDVHAEMALAYRKKIKGLREHASYTIVSEPD
jgi:hypothetical protein